MKFFYKYKNKKFIFSLSQFFFEWKLSRKLRRRFPSQRFHYLKSALCIFSGETSRYCSVLVRKNLFRIFSARYILLMMKHFHVQSKSSVRSRSDNANRGGFVRPEAINWSFSINPLYEDAINPFPNYNITSYIKKVLMGKLWMRCCFKNILKYITLNKLSLMG